MSIQKIRSAGLMSRVRVVGGKTEFPAEQPRCHMTNLQRSVNRIAPISQDSVWSLRQITSDHRPGYGVSLGNEDPFNPEAPKLNRWLVTGSVAGVACTLVIGTAVFGSVTSGNQFQTATTSKNHTILQESDTVGKGDLVKLTNSSPITITGSITSAPSSVDASYKRISGSFAPASGGEDKPNNRSHLQTKTLVGALAPIYPDPDEVSLSYKDDGTASVSSSETNTTTVEKSAAPVPYTKTVDVGASETLTGVLVQLGVNESVVSTIVRAMNPVYPVKKIRNQKVQFTLIKRRNFYGETEVVPLKLAVIKGPKARAVAELSPTGKYVTFKEGFDQPKKVKPRYKPKVQVAETAGRIRTKAKIRKNLYMSARKHGVPEHIVANVMRVHSYDVDFQRQIRSGDSFEAYFGDPIGGKKTKRPVLLYSHLDLKGRKSKGYYRFTTPDDGITSYYDLKGRSAAKSLMRTPISGARITSRFGMRRHPILGYSKMHAGIDFGAAYGTPVKAAGSGKVEVARRVGAYGKYIRIKHSNGYKTAYAHLSRYAKSVKAGRKVRQGQIIGYVGSTGRSTGPHLHYEVLRGDRRINPLRVRIAGGRRLKGKMLKKFKRMVAKIDSLRAKAPTTTRLASNSR